VIGAVLTGLFGFAYFAMLNTMAPALILIAIVLSFIPHALTYGPQAALIAECFTPRLRYSGASIGYQLSSVISGGPAPLIATALLAAVGDASAFAKGRDLAAWLGLTPRQHSTGGKTKLLGISKRGYRGKKPGRFGA